MTLEQNQYGGGYVKCARCGVKQRPERLELRGPCDSSESFEKAWCCKRLAQCNEWRKSLRAARWEDIRQVVDQSLALAVSIRAQSKLDRAIPPNEPNEDEVPWGPDELLAEVHK